MWVLAVALLGSVDARGQEGVGRATSSTSGLWLGMYSRYRLADKFWFHGEYHVRRRRLVLTEMAQLYLRFGVTWRPLDNLELTGGVVTPLYWSENDPPAGITRVVPQFRFWEQAVLTQNISRVKLYHQYRFEQRWRRDFLEDSPFLLTWRWRYRITAYVPINQPRMAKGTFFAAANQEVFIQTGKSIIYDIFEDNRIYGGVGYVINDNLQVQTGYMFTYRHDGAPDSFQNRHIYRISVYHNFDLRTLWER